MHVKRTMPIGISLCLLSFILLFSIGITYSQGAKETAFTGEFKPSFVNDRIVIKLSSELDKAKLRLDKGTVITGLKSLDNLNKRFKVSNMTQLFPGSAAVAAAVEHGLPRIYRLEFPAVPDVREVVKMYADDRNVAYAQPIGIHKVFATTPNDQYWSNQWGLTRIKAPEAWDITQGDTSVILAIVDTGVDWLHPDLGGASPYIRGNIWTNWAEYYGTTGVDDDNNGYVDDIRGWDWVDVTSSSYPPYPGEDGTIPDNNPMDFNGHGTHCAGIASAITNNATGVAGLGWNCKIMPLRVGWSANYMGYEVGLVDMSFCAQAIYYAANNGASAVNCSWGSSNTGGLADAVNFATSMGTIVVSAAGNDDMPDASFLCSRQDVIAVAATDPSDTKASYSSYGYWVDIAAPGGDSPPVNNEIFSTYFDHLTGSHTYDWLRGTSMAAPHVVGLIGLINSQFPGVNWQGVKERVQYTSDNIDLLNPFYKNGLLGEGRINAFNAVSQTDLPFMTTIFTENFDSGLPPSWTADLSWRDNDPGNKNADYDDIYEPGTIKVGYDIWKPPFMIVDSDYEGYVLIDASLVSPIIDCSMFSDIRLVFNNWFQNYGGGYLEQGDIDVRIDNGNWQTVASFVDNGAYNIVDAAREVVVRLPSFIDYQSNVQFRWHYYNAEFDWFWGIDNINLIGQMITDTLRVSLSPSFQSAGGDTGKAVSYRLKVKNIGLQSDSYDLKALDFAWQTTIWDSAGTSQITNTGILASTEELYLTVKVEIPMSAAIGETDAARIMATSTTDAAVFAAASLVTRFVQLDRIPWFEDFAALDPLKWPVNTGPAGLSTLGMNPPSPPFSLNLNGDAIGGDEIQSCSINLLPESGVILKYYWQRTGGGDSPEAGDDLWVDYLSASGNWLSLKHHLGEGPDMISFDSVSVALPADAYHTNFKIRFRNAATTGAFDDWFIDDVHLTWGPDMVVVPDPAPLDFYVDLGDSATGTLTIKNLGKGYLNFSISHSFITNNIKANFIQTSFYNPDNEDDAKKDPNFDKNARTTEGLYIGKMANNNSAILAAGDVLKSWPAPAPIVHSWGVGFDKINVWIADVSNLDDHEITTSGVRLGSFSCASWVGAWPGDMAYDGQYLWQVNVGGDNGIYQLDPATGAVINSIHDPGYTWDAVSQRGLAYDPTEDVFYVGGWNSNMVFRIKGLSWNNPGEILSSFSFLNVSGLGWHPAGSLWIATNEYTDMIYQVNPLNGTILSQFAAPGTGDGYWAGGLEVNNEGNLWVVCQDNNSVYLVDSGEPLFTWLKEHPRHGSVAPGDSAVVLVTVYATDKSDVLPETKYQATIDVRSTPVEQDTSISVSMTVNPVDYYFRVDPAAKSSQGIAGDTLSFPIMIKNYGRLTDSYNLAAAGNTWHTTFWDSSGANQITNTGPVASKATLGFLAKVEIPANTNYGATDTANVMIGSAGQPGLARSVVIASFSFGTPDTVPWFDDFATGRLEPDNWIYNSGPAEVNTLGINPPSPPYALNFNGDSTGGDEVQSTLINLAKDSVLVLAYAWQRMGGGNSPETGEDLWVDYRNSSGTWVNLKQHPGDGPDMTNFEVTMAALPADAYHKAFQVRFRSKATIGKFDDWFVDDVAISYPPVIKTAPQGYEVTVIAGDSVKGQPPLTISNEGVYPLHYKISSFLGKRPNFTFELEPAIRDYPASYFSPDLEKGEADPRKGAPVILNAGGPDNFGHYWIDSDEPAGPTFKWVDITNVGTQITGIGDDDNVGPFPIGFNFPFYGNSFNTFRLCANGFISFTSMAYTWMNEPIPNQIVFNLVAPFWDDLYYDYTSNAFYYFDGEKLIIQSNNVLRRDTSERNTFEVFLYKDGTIMFQYLTMQTSSISATIGIQNEDGSDGLEIAFNTSYVHNNLAVRIASGITWIEFDRTSGVIAKGETDTINVQFNSREINEDSVLYADIVIHSNDPLNPAIKIPAKMEVITAEIISGAIRTNGNPLENAIVQVWNEYPNGLIIDQDTTEADGKYFLAVPPVGGIYTVRTFASGYVPAFREKIPGNTFNLNFNLAPVVSITPTNEWVDFYSSHSEFWDGPVQIGDVITAEDTSGVVCGVFTVTRPGDYGFMPVYRDDIYTPNIDEGAEPGDSIIFKINGYKAEALGPDRPAWTNHGEIRNVDLYVAEIDTVKIPLAAGWNLISWYVKTAQDSSHKILKDILSNVTVVLSYEKGALVYDPKNPTMSNLKEMDHQHGYWIRMAQMDTLLVIGNPADVMETPIHCESGWNLVSYLPRKPDSVAHAFATVMSNLVRAYGFKNGAMTFDPAKPEFSTLHILGPTFGYWLNLMQADTLSYPEKTLLEQYPGADPMLFKMLAAKGQNFIPTNEWINIYAQEIKLDGALLPAGTKISARDPNGTICGEFIVTTPGSFGFMPVYRDDPNTSLDEGAKSGDEISIYFNDYEIPVKLTWTSFGDFIDLGAIITSVAGDLKSLPKEYNLSHNYPNPFNPETAIKFQLPQPGQVTLKIYNMLGQLVRTLVAEPKKAGYYQVSWDGRDNRGILVANGVYLYQLKAGNYEKTRKMVMLK